MAILAMIHGLEARATEPEVRDSPCGCRLCGRLN